MRRGGSVSGAVSMVMIFCVLCLAVFSVLTLATAVRERTLSNLSAESAANYYQADTQATKTVAALLRGEAPDGVTVRDEPEGRLAAFTVDINEQQKLDVEVLLRDGECEVRRWATIYTGDWQTDESIDIWNGDF